jgi:hypothetical protein
VIDGHGGIWQAPFLLFIASIVFQHVQASKETPAAASATAAPRERVEPSGDLADFAKSIGPIRLDLP